jgi:hypothetical protein
MNLSKNQKEVALALAWGAIFIPLALGLREARQHGYVDPETVTRVVSALNGLMIAWYGNRMPKDFVPSARARQVRRFGGWSLSLSGLAFIALCAFAPMPLALQLGAGVLLAGIALSFGYCLLLARR